MEGAKVPKDLKKAFEYYKKSADQGNSDAQYTVGHAYEEGLGVPKDLQKAETYYNAAADQGDENAYIKAVGFAKKRLNL